MHHGISNFPCEFAIFGNKFHLRNLAHLPIPFVLILQSGQGIILCYLSYHAQGEAFCECCAVVAACMTDIVLHPLLVFLSTVTKKGTRLQDATILNDIRSYLFGTTER